MSPGRCRRVDAPDLPRVDQLMYRAKTGDGGIVFNAADGQESIIPPATPRPDRQLGKCPSAAKVGLCPAMEGLGS